MNRAFQTKRAKGVIAFYQTMVSNGNKRGAQKKIAQLFDITPARVSQIIKQYGEGQA